MEKCSTSFIIREIANENHNEIAPHTSQNTSLSSKSLQITNVGKNVEKEEFSYTVGGNVNCKLVQPLMYVVQHFLKELKIELPCDSAVLLLSIYPKKMKTVIWKDTCISMVIETCSIIYNNQDMKAT